MMYNMDMIIDYIRLWCKERHLESQEWHTCDSRWTIISQFLSQETRQYLIWDREGEENTVDEVATTLFEAAEKGGEDSGKAKSSRKSKDKKKKKKPAKKGTKGKKNKKKKKSSSSSSQSSKSSSESSESEDSNNSSDSSSEAGFWFPWCTLYSGS